MGELLVSFWFYDTNDTQLKTTLYHQSSNYYFMTSIFCSPYNHVLYGNRSQSFLKTKDLWLVFNSNNRLIKSEICHFE